MGEPLAFDELLVDPLFASPSLVEEEEPLPLVELIGSDSFIATGLCGTQNQLILEWSLVRELLVL